MYYDHPLIRDRIIEFFGRRLAPQVHAHRPAFRVVVATSEPHLSEAVCRLLNELYWQPGTSGYLLHVVPSLIGEVPMWLV